MNHAGSNIFLISDQEMGHIGLTQPQKLAHGAMVAPTYNNYLAISPVKWNLQHTHNAHDPFLEKELEILDIWWFPDNEWPNKSMIDPDTILEFWA